jgi:hypothetical protein
VKAYILGLPDSFRGEPLIASLADQGLESVVVWGVDAATWTSADLARVYSREAARVVSHRDLTPGEVACVLGHRAMMEAFAGDGDHWALLMEDDARLVRALDPLVEILPTLPTHPMIIQLDWRRGLTDAAAPGSDGETPHLRRLSRPMYGAYGYLMNRPAALVALRAYARHRVDSTADWPFGWSHLIDFRCPQDPYVEHPRSYAGSTLQSGRRLSVTDASSRSTTVRMVRGSLRLIGVAALYGRLHGVSFRRLLRRDVTEIAARLRSRS